MELNAAQRLTATSDQDNVSKALIDHNFKLPLFEVAVDGAHGTVYAKQVASQIRTGNVNIFLKMQGEKDVRIGAYTDHPRNTVSDLKSYVKEELLEEGTITRSL
jgi:hypothetical protein